MGTPLSVSYARKEDIPFLWDGVEPLIASAMAHDSDDYYKEKFKRELEEGRMILWLVHKKHELIAIMVTEVIRRWGDMVLRVVAVAGKEMDEWVDLLESYLLYYAQELGCKKIQALCRDGMVKKLSRRNWNKVSTVMEYGW